LVYNEVLSIGHLQVFGCGAYVHIPSEVRKDKLSPRGELMIFLGYLDGIKGYFFMRLPNNILFKGTTAIFDEEMMPKCSKVIKRRFTPIGDKKPSTEDPPIPMEANDEDDFLPHCQSPSPVQRDNANDDDDDLSQHSLLHMLPRQQEQLPPAQPPPPQRSGHEQRLLVRPDNVYGDKRNPIDLHHEVLLVRIVIRISSRRFLRT
jgi:hypothetical protein